MAHFFIPPGADKNNYDINSRSPVPGEVWRMRIRERHRSPIALYGGTSLSIVSNNPNVMPTSQILRKNGAQKDVEIVSLYGMQDGTTLVFAGTGQYQTPSWNHWLTLQVNVSNRDDQKTYIIALESKHMALNAHDTPVPYTMDHTEKIASGLTASDVLNKVKAAAKKEGGKLKHLAISSHGGDADIRLGKGIGPGDVDLFKDLKGMIGVIWAGACVVAGGDAGMKMCKQIATNAGCYLVAAAYSVPSAKVSKGQVDVSPKCMPKVFTPAGDLKSLIEFLGFGETLGFRVTT